MDYDLNLDTYFYRYIHIRKRYNTIEEWIVYIQASLHNKESNISAIFYLNRLQFTFYFFLKVQRMPTTYYYYYPIHLYT